MTTDVSETPQSSENRTDAMVDEHTEADEGGIAHHEAGHLIAACSLRIPFNGRRAITIVPSDTYDGAFIYKNILLGADLEWDTSDRNRLKMERVVQVSLAGIEAQRHYEPSSIRYGDGFGDWDGGDDYHRAINLLNYFTSGTRETEAYLELMRIRSQNLIQKPHNWKCIGALADALLIKKTLSAKEARKVVDTTMLDFVRDHSNRSTS